MLLKVDDTFLKGVKILFAEILLINSTVIFERSDCCNKNNSIRLKTCHSAFDIKEFLCSKICTKTCLCYGIIGNSESSLGRSYGITAVCNIGKWSAMNNNRIVLKSLNNIGLNGILQKSCHSSYCVELTSRNRLAISCISNDYSGKSLLEVIHIVSKTKNSHDLRSNCNYKVIFSRNTVSLCSKTNNNISERSVIHIKSSFPDDLSGVYSKFITLLNMIINNSGEKIIG